MASSGGRGARQAPVLPPWRLKNPSRFYRFWLIRRVPVLHDCFDPLSSWDGSWCDLVYTLLFLRGPCYMKNMSTTVLDRFLRPFTECLTPEVAQRIVSLQLDSQSQARLDELAAKANDGQLTDDERQEYEEFVEGIDLMGILKARARTVLAKHLA